MKVRPVRLTETLLTATTLLAGSGHAANQGSPGPGQLYGHVTSDRVLSAPTYSVIGDLTVDPGVTLTVARGVMLTFVSNSDYLASGADPNRAELIVYGHLIVPPR
jgi:hypothetical protein